jgi:beta-barrel assembly-enhancing protease
MEWGADDGALKRMLAIGISPIGASEFFIRFEKQNPTPKALEFISTHPDSGARAKRFWEADKGKTDPPIMTDNEWASLKSICEAR